MLPNVQMLGEVLQSGIKNSNVICMQGPFSENMNYEMIKNYGIEVMVTKKFRKYGRYTGKKLMQQCVQGQR